VLETMHVYTFSSPIRVFAYRDCVILQALHLELSYGAWRCALGIYDKRSFECLDSIHIPLHSKPPNLKIHETQCIETPLTIG